eukprot:Tamp_21728.p1 GENE.Tamp_21728~~Tamp_21728.p1  ORF type:complete len:158 (+),score=35.83 Tamp_21728:493-966(+)
MCERDFDCLLLVSVLPFPVSVAVSLPVSVRVCGYSWSKSVGLGFKTPLDAKDGVYIDKKCPWTGNVSIRGKLLRGVVVSNKMKRTIVIRRDYLHYIKKYNRYEKRHKNVPAHCSPAFKLNLGDNIIVGQCRPLSKTVRFNVLSVVSEATSGKGFSKY